ncbi:hypothetical protein QFC21_006126 [Naganishia friedmannii]|uniref:Uncharacterized protein n=1 Tax=Naganishia friedmannii TaxID=89922 RepID=A0ACC2V4R8_9TREE|nr:hypothetical protein QFC21_006126 [Naganishia friedmannii]
MYGPDLRHITSPHGTSNQSNHITFLIKMPKAGTSAKTSKAAKVKALKLKEGARKDVKGVMESLMNRTTELTQVEQRATSCALEAQLGWMQHSIWMDKIAGKHLVNMEAQRNRELVLLERQAANFEMEMKMLEDACKDDPAA